MAICDTYLDQIDGAYSEAIWSLNVVQPYLTWLQNNYTTSGFTYTWREAVALSLLNLEDAISYLVYGNWMLQTPVRIPYYLRNCIAAPEIDMSAILIAMLRANPDDVMYFIGLTDAYRQSVWNRPFNEEFFAALARGFAVWE